jgi:membrane protein YdbS with pleckstrin-like domain
VTPRRRRRSDDPFAGSLDTHYPSPTEHQRIEQQHEEEDIRVRPVGEEPPERSGRRGPDRGEAPSVLRRLGQGIVDLRRRIIPLPDEIIDDFLATGEQVIHSDHPSFRSFVVENTLLVLGLLAAGAAFIGIAFNGSFTASAVLFVVLALLLLYLVLKRLEERYTSYVVTDSRIMRLQGILSRRSHSIPWVRVTDLTFRQSGWGRLFGYATLRIDSANEESGLRDLEGVSDPLLFTKHVVDMVVAKQGATQPKWAAAGLAPPPETERGFRRVRMTRRRRGEPRGTSRTGPVMAGSSPERWPEPIASSGGRTTGTRVPRPPSRPPAEDPFDVGGDEDLDPELLASELQAADDHDLDLPWADDPLRREPER